MNTYYGVDSVDDARTVLPNLHRLWGAYPAVYARYIVGGFVTSAAECAAILALGVRVVHVCNFGDAGTVGGTAADGLHDAHNALTAMRATGCPPGQGLLFRDIESAWVPSVAYLGGWCSGMYEAQQPGGFYANAEWATFDTPYAALVGAVARRYRYVWTSEPENVGYVPPPGPAWNPYAPPSDPAACIGWQFVEEPGPIPDIDCNLWTEEAYNLMWGATPVAPAARHVVTPGSLKVIASHSDPRIAVDHAHRPVYLEPGATFYPVKLVEHTDDDWIFGHLAAPEQDVHGYFPNKALSPA